MNILILKIKIGKKDMNEEINLYKILKGHENEIFWSPCLGDAYVKEIHNDIIRIEGCSNHTILALTNNGRYNRNGECMLFPSKDQRDWNKWTEAQKPKIPKTWNDLINSHLTEESYCTIGFEINKNNLNLFEECGNTFIEKSALALLKIHQLIEVGYGGNVTIEEWNTMKDIYQIDYEVHSNTIRISNSVCMRFFTPIAFHTQEQAKVFLSYPENVELLKDYFMI